MSLILATSEEIVVGKPLLWPLYDQQHKLLLAQGDVVRDDAHREALLAGGAFHELSWEMANGAERGDESILAGDEEARERTGPDQAGARYTFDDMKLKVEDRLQLEPPAHLARERFLVKVIGFLRGASLLVTMPIAADGLRLLLKEKERVVMRSFSGRNAFGFASTVERIIRIPYEYMHLSVPDDIQGIVVRKSPRVRTRIIATVEEVKSTTAEQVSALISDISANGVSVESKQPLGKKGDLLNLTFRMQVHNVDAYLQVKGVVRVVLDSDADDAPKSGLIHHGIEFVGLQPNDSLALQSMIYQQMIENPHNLV